MPIYVEIPIRCNLEELWEKTQRPDLHERWDLRFSEISYLPPKEGESQKFLYTTKIAGGMRIAGGGESTGEHTDSHGERSSALKFWSHDPKSLIEFGSGYWKYIPDDDFIRFITWYDYRTRFGMAGKAIDKCLFRPLIGWATAWSFDRLRLWIEKGIPPGVSRNQTLIYYISRFAVAFIWLYHGLIPKLLYPSADEFGMLSASGFPASVLDALVPLLGIVEICIAAAIVIFGRSRWPLWLTVIFMPIALAAVGFTSSSFLSAAFNPVTLNLATMALASVALLSGKEIPSALNCIRKPSES
jgi:hypothetical protein